MFSNNFVLKIMALAGGIIIALQALLSTYLIVREKSTYEQKLMERSEITTSDLQASLVDPLWNMEVEKAIDVIKLRMRQSFFVGVKITDMEGKVLVHMSRIEGKAVQSDKLATGSSESQVVFTQDSKEFAKGTFVYSDEEDKSNLRKTMLILIISNVFIALFIVALLWWVLKLQVEQPIQETSSALKNIASGDGDLTARLSEGRTDQIGRLSRWFNQFIGKLQGSIRKVTEITTTLSVASKELSTTANQMDSRSESMTHELAGTSESVSQTSKNLIGIATSASDMAQSLESVAAAVEEMNATVHLVAKNAMEDVSIANEANSRGDSAKLAMDELFETTSQIGKLVDMIQDIAAQTNLLALNATIEAASAGEAGKGFAVVAAEVKDLARQTAQASDQVRAQVESVRKKSEASRELMLSASGFIQKIKENTTTLAYSMEQQKSAISEISHSFSAVANHSRKVSDTVGVTSESLRKISDNISRVTQDARSMKESVNEVRSGASNLANLSTDLQVVVQQFKV